MLNVDINQLVADVVNDKNWEVIANTGKQFGVAIAPLLLFALRKLIPLSNVPA